MSEEALAEKKIPLALLGRPLPGPRCERTWLAAQRAEAWLQRRREPHTALVTPIPACLQGLGLDLSPSLPPWQVPLCQAEVTQPNEPSWTLTRGARWWDWGTVTGNPGRCCCLLVAPLRPWLLPRHGQSVALSLSPGGSGAAGPSRPSPHTHTDLWGHPWEAAADTVAVLLSAGSRALRSIMTRDK